MDTKIEHTNKEIEKLDYLDALRGIAILMVILVHGFAGLLLTNQFWHAVIDFGRFGVTLFFLVSAYTLYKSWEQRKEESYSTVKYFIRRLFRIAPAYFLVIILASLSIGHPSGWSTENYISWQNILTHFIFINFLFKEYTNSIIGVEWTIPVEFIFYILLPIFLLLSTKFKNKYVYWTTILIISLIFSILSSFIINKYGQNYCYWSVFFPLVHLPIFILGILTFLFVQNYKGKIFNNLYFLLYLILLGIYICFLNPKIDGKFILMFFNLNYILASFALLFLIIFLAKTKGLIYSFFCNQITIFLGKVSFSLYLIHFLTFVYLPQSINKIIILNPFILAWAAITLSIICAYLLYIIVEKNGIKLGKYVISKF